LNQEKDIRDKDIARVIEVCHAGVDGFFRIEALTIEYAGFIGFWPYRVKNRPVWIESSELNVEAP